jgi:hypothetical protein
MVTKIIFFFIYQHLFFGEMYFLRWIRLNVPLVILVLGSTTTYAFCVFISLTMYGPSNNKKNFRITFSVTELRRCDLIKMRSPTLNLVGAP